MLSPFCKLGLFPNCDL